MQLYYIRHGQSQNNLLYEKTGSSNGRSHDPQLTEAGVKQADLLADFIYQRKNDYQGRNERNEHGFGITHIYCSLMERAVLTASPLARVLGLPLTAWVDIHETGGIFLDNENKEQIGLPGKTRKELLDLNPDLILPDSLNGTGWWNRAFEGSEERDVRARRVVADLCAKHGQTNDRVVFVSHGGFYHHFFAALMGIPYADRFFFHLNNTGISRFNFENGGVELVYHNRTEHLPVELLT